MTMQFNRMKESLSIHFEYTVIEHSTELINIKSLEQNYIDNIFLLLSGKFQETPPPQKKLR